MIKINILVVSVFIQLCCIIQVYGAGFFDFMKEKVSNIIPSIEKDLRVKSGEIYTIEKVVQLNKVYLGMGRSSQEIIKGLSTSNHQNNWIVIMTPMGTYLRLTKNKYGPFTYICRPRINLKNSRRSFLASSCPENDEEKFELIEYKNQNNKLLGYYIKFIDGKYSGLYLDLDNQNQLGAIQTLSIPWKFQSIGSDIIKDGTYSFSSNGRLLGSEFVLGLGSPLALLPMKELATWEIKQIGNTETYTMTQTSNDDSYVVCKLNGYSLLHVSNGCKSEAIFIFEKVSPSEVVIREKVSNSNKFNSMAIPAVTKSEDPSGSLFLRVESKEKIGNSEIRWTFSMPNYKYEMDFKKKNLNI